MRSFLLSIFLLFVYSPFSLGFTSDVYYIETITADSVIFLDTLKLNSFADIYTKDAVFGAPTLNLPTVNSSEQLIAEAFILFPPSVKVVLQDAITTQRITPVGPTNKDYTFAKAKVITYLTTTFFGTGNLTGQIAAIYSRLDDSLVKTDLPGYGGWRITERILSAFVSFIPCLVIPPYFIKSPPAPTEDFWSGELVKSCSNKCYILKHVFGGFYFLLPHSRSPSFKKNKTPLSSAYIG